MGTRTRRSGTVRKYGPELIPHLEVPCCVPSLVALLMQYFEVVNKREEIDMEKSDHEIYTKQFDHPDERREFKAHGHLDMLSFKNGMAIGHAVFEPGWRWADDVKPLAGTESCQASHLGYCTKGSMTIRMDDGVEFNVKSGDAFQIPPGHDAWVNGNENCEMLDVTGYLNYAVQKEPLKKAA